MKTKSASHQVETTLDIISKRADAYGELTGRFGPLLREKARLSDEFAAENITPPSVDPARIAAGAHVLAGLDLSPWKDSLLKSSHTLMPLLGSSLGLNDESLERFTAYLNDTDNILELAQARIEGNWKCFENTSVQLSVQPDITLYVTETVSSPVFSSIAGSLGELFSRENWTHGYCPICGSTPSIALLAPAEAEQSEYLVGGGGRKYLHCSLCGHDWHYARTACAACGNDDAESREIIHQDGMKFERIEACHKCGKYMLTVDQREYTEPPHPDTIQMGLIHLDVIARQRNLVPVSPTLWNTIE